MWLAERAFEGRKGGRKGRRKRKEGRHGLWMGGYER
jgi:hypothetical protein